MPRRLIPLLLLAPLAASCQPPEILVRAVFIGNALAFVDAGSSADSTLCWSEAAVIDDSLEPVWRFAGPRTGECGGLFPLVYGRAPEGAETVTPARRLEPGRLYLVVGDATAAVSGAFALTRAGEARIVHNVDPDSSVADSLRRRWWQRRAARNGRR